MHRPSSVESFDGAIFSSRLKSVCARFSVSLSFSLVCKNSFAIFSELFLISSAVFFSSSFALFSRIHCSYSARRRATDSLSRETVDRVITFSIPGTGLHKRLGTFVSMCLVQHLAVLGAGSESLL